MTQLIIYVYSLRWVPAPVVAFLGWAVALTGIGVAGKAARRFGRDVRAHGDKRRFENGHL